MSSSHRTALFVHNADVKLYQRRFGAHDVVDVLRSRSDDAKRQEQREECRPVAEGEKRTLVLHA
jgi:hypothetical protein